MFFFPRAGDPSLAGEGLFHIVKVYLQIYIYFPLGTLQRCVYIHTWTNRPVRYIGIAIEEMIGGT